MSERASGRLLSDVSGLTFSFLTKNTSHNNTLLPVIMTFINSNAFAPYNIVKRRSSEDSTDGEPMNTTERTAKRTKRQKAPSPPQVHHYLTPNSLPARSMPLFSSPVQHHFRAIPATQEDPLSEWSYAQNQSSPF